MSNVLSITLWLPIAAAVLLVFFPKSATGAIKGVGLLASLATFAASLGIVNGFREGVAALQLVEMRTWIPQWGITYNLGVDGISLWLVMLTTLLTPIVFLSSWNAIHKHPKEYVIAFLVMDAAIKFFLFTITGSLLMLLGIIYLVFRHAHDSGITTFTITELYGLHLPLHLQAILFFAFALAFAIKVPLFTLHTWLPDAHVEAPT